MPDQDKNDEGEGLAEIRRWLDAFQHEVERHERAVSIALENIVLLKDRLDEAATPPAARGLALAKRRRRTYPRKPAMLTASQVILSRRGKSKLVVGGVIYEVALRPLEFDLMSLLSDP